MSGKIITIDGPSNAGKTTLCDFIAEKYSFKMILESGRRKLHPKPSTNLQEELVNQQFYFDEERIRLNEAIELSRQGFNVVLDRSAISVLSIAYSYEKTGKYNTYEDANIYFDKEFYDFDDVVNKKVILIADLKELKKRNVSQKLPESWVNDKFASCQIEFYKELKMTDKIILDSSESSLEDLSKYICGE